jgi:hypothetical protein
MAAAAGADASSIYLSSLSSLLCTINYMHTVLPFHISTNRVEIWTERIV